jgi:hypothetical protein
MNTAVAPPNAPDSADASSISATASSQPSASHSSPFFASRTIPRTGWWAASNVRASSPPTFPVMPVIAYNVVLQSNMLVCTVASRRERPIQRLVRIG